MYVFDQGRILKESQVSVSIRNKGLNYGLGCIEGIRAFWNDRQNQLYIFRINEHYQRFHESGKTLHIQVPFSINNLIDWTIQLLRKNNFREDVYIRPICYKGANLIGPGLADPFNRVSMYCTKLEYKPKPALRVSISSWNRLGNNVIPPQAKSTGGYLNSALATTEAILNGFDEAIFLTDKGHVSEGPGENIFIIKNNKLITPPISDNILAGITRDTVIKIATNILKIPVYEQSLSRSEIYSSDEVFFTGTAIGIKPIITIDNRIIGKGTEGDTTKYLRLYYEDIVRGNNPSFLGYCTQVY
ncbi:branched-chain amino acid transaminase [Bacillus sp. ISL-47]|uniref:branched-chain amino acid transaminase n=1 Tax=Bacillus sp. ISL-47 TaxID=2819130 RepID=UPI001BE89376|nr:branched-chain amino acid transaminase [Bacillus sp. ISL-47]MBT2690625.1 branched-chain amino acid transaminase [Bacillus sp. ISL-47]MBT2710842.1 branched-chain amino acid transaminase [Pseudomonas sp. ISL-84]